MAEAFERNDGVAGGEAGIETSSARAALNYGESLGLVVAEGVAGGEAPHLTAGVAFGEALGETLVAQQWLAIM